MATHAFLFDPIVEHSLDFSEGGYRDYINELGFEECKRISRAEGWQENSCQESFERNAFGLHYGSGPIPPNPPPTMNGKRPSAARRTLRAVAG